MIYQSSEIQGKRIKIGHDNDDHPAVVVVSRNFWNEAPEDLLSEIFIRLPDSRSAVRSSTVCRLWHSLILRNPQFIPRFTSQHHKRGDLALPCTISLCKAELLIWPPPEAQRCQPICNIFSEEWMFLHGKFSPNYLDFLPLQMLIRAACNDLLLVSLGAYLTKQHYICNPITKQYLKLPLTPMSPGPYWLAASGYALLCMPPAPPTNNTRFKVVEFLPHDYPFPQEPGALVHFIVQVFCSESRTWETKSFHFPRLMTEDRIDTRALDIVTCNGVFYWFENSRESSRVIYLDLLKEQCGAINIPSDHDSEYRPRRIGVVHACGGEHEELRLIQVDAKSRQSHIGLKTWRLNNMNDIGDSSWVLVHNIRSEWPTNLWGRQHYFVHPTKGDLLFTVWGQDVFEFDLISATYKKIEQLLDTAFEDMLMPFPMVLTHCYGTSSNFQLDQQDF